MMPAAVRDNSHGVWQVSAIVVNFNGGTDLLTCLAALCGQLRPGDIVVVDNASTDGSAELASAQYPQVRVVTSATNLGFAGGANLGAAQSPAEFLLFLNPDAFVMPGCVERLLKALARGAGVVGPILRTGAEETPEYGLTIDVTGMPRGLVAAGLPLYVSGCCLATSRQCFDAVGGFDDRYFLLVEDVEYCWQALRRGYDVQAVSGAEAHHRGGGSMSGGYVRGDTVEVNGTRIVLRERNTTAMLLACAPVVWLPIVMCASVFRGVAFATLLASRHRWRSVWELVVGVGQNLVWLPGTIRRRRRPGVRRSAARAACRRIERRVFLWEYVRARRPISFVDVEEIRHAEPVAPTSPNEL